MHLTGIKLGNVPPFTDPITLKFDERVNVFIGPNASGKSTLLQVLENHFGGNDKSGKRPIAGVRSHLSLCDYESFNIWTGSDDPDWSTRNYLSADEEWVGTREKRRGNANAPPVIVIGTAREGLPGISNQPDTGDFGETAGEILAGPFSGSRTMAGGDLLGKELRTLGDEISGNGGEAPYRKLRFLEDAEVLADACSLQVCQEVVREARSHNYIPDIHSPNILLDPHAEPSEINVLRRRGINTTDQRNFATLSSAEQPAKSFYREGEDLPIYLGHLSSGTEGTLLWIRWLALQLVYHYEFQEGWHEKPAILLIDEIENHLHPTWQRRVIPALLEHFPGLQIFATTHSPFVVAGLKAGQVHVLKRDEKGVVTASTEQRDVVGWTMDEILRGMMGVDDPTDEYTAKAAMELRGLRNEGPRADEKAEEARQQRMLELRAMVDRDLLAGGPMAAQREQFEQQFAEALENYSRTQDLEQENH
ncbi:MAG: AAA family ATPase [Chloroflexi bacterium]|nr:AAA family ATPase [Chloroflexota bacterium]